MARTSEEPFALPVVDADPPVRADAERNREKVLCAAARLFATGGPGWASAQRSAPNSAIYYGLGVTEHSQGSSTVMAIANLAMATGNIGRRGGGGNGG